MIKEMYESYFSTASCLGDFQSMSKTELANGYCDADESKDFIKRDQYYAALMLRYWYKIYDFYQDSHSAQLELEEFSSWVSESLDIGLKYRRWRDPSNLLSKDPNGPDKVFNRSFLTTRKRWYTYFNKDKRKLNYLTTDSIESWSSINFDDSPSEVGEIADKIFYESGNYSTIQIESPSQSVVKHYLKQGKILEAFIVDSIAHQDTFNTKSVKRGKNIIDSNGQKVSVKITKTEFSNRKVVKHLNDLNNVYLKYFHEVYGVDKEKLNAVANQVNKISNTKLYNYIEKTLLELRTNDEIISILRG
jgi:hypothetical protein